MARCIREGKLEGQSVPPMLFFLSSGGILFPLFFFLVVFFIHISIFRSSIVCPCLSVPPSSFFVDLLHCFSSGCISLFALPSAAWLGACVSCVSGYLSVCHFGFLLISVLFVVRSNSAVVLLSPPRLSRFLLFLFFLLFFFSVFQAVVRRTDIDTVARLAVVLLLLPPPPPPPLFFFIFLLFFSFLLSFFSAFSLSLSGCCSSRGHRNHHSQDS